MASGHFHKFCVVRESKSFWIIAQAHRHTTFVNEWMTQCPNHQSHSFQQVYCIVLSEYCPRHSFHPLHRRNQQQKAGIVSRSDKRTGKIDKEACLSAKGNQKYRSQPSFSRTAEPRVLPGHRQDVERKGRWAVALHRKTGHRSLGMTFDKGRQMLLPLQRPVLPQIGLGKGIVMKPLPLRA